MVNSLIKRGSVYYQQKQMEKFIKDFKQAEIINPNSSEIFHHRAQVIIRINNNKIKFNKNVL